MQSLQDSKRNNTNHSIKNAELLPATNLVLRPIALRQAWFGFAKFLILTKAWTWAKWSWKLHTSLGDQSLANGKTILRSLRILLFSLDRSAWCRPGKKACGHRKQFIHSTKYFSIHIEPLLQCSEGLKNQPPKCQGEPWQVTSPFHSAWYAWYKSSFPKTTVSLGTWYQGATVSTRTHFGERKRWSKARRVHLLSSGQHYLRNKQWMSPRIRNKWTGICHMYIMYTMVPPSHLQIW